MPGAAGRDGEVMLAIDLGTSGAKVALVSLGGSVLAWAERPVTLHLLGGGGVEQDPDDWWRAISQACGELRAAHRDLMDDVAGVCSSTQGEGTVAVDVSGRPLTRCLMWMDTRGAASLKAQFSGRGSERIGVGGLSAANVARWVRLTGGMPSTTGKDPASHMLYVRDTMPEVYERTHAFLNVLDYLNLRMTGRVCATYDSILTSWVTDNRDADAVRYAPSLVSRCGIDADKLPEIVRCTDVVGGLTAQAAHDLGLRTGTPVVAGAIDTTAAAVGAGTTAPYDTHVYLGTSTWMAAHVPVKRTAVRSGLASVPCAVPGHWLLTALQATAGGNLTFLRDRILYHKDELLAEAEVPDVFKIFDEIVTRVRPGANGVMYLPWIHGERAPVEDGNLRAGLVNLSLANSREDIIRAFFEGIALNTRWLAQPVARFMRRDLERVTLIGGGARSAAWCQVFADVLQVPVRQAENPIAANARGAAFIGGVGLGLMSYDDVPAIVPMAAEYQPHRSLKGLYDERFDVFTTLHKQLAPVYRRLNGSRP